jgi:predicted TIM-barrel fold metal-dependent hydrolase
MAIGLNASEEAAVDHGFSVIDPHQHFWQLGHGHYPWLEEPAQIFFRYGNYNSIRRSYLPQDYRRDTVHVHVVQTVHIEAECDRSWKFEETTWLGELSRTFGLPSACVAYAALGGTDAEEVLARHAASSLVRGIREKPAAAANAREARRGLPGSMDDPAWRRGYQWLSRHSFSFDLQTPWWHLDAAADLARDFRDTTIVLNHTGLPADRSAEGLAAWRLGLELVAGAPNVALKISGLGRPGRPWMLEANGPVIRDAISIFGSDRCMFASNYPVDSLVGSFDEIFACFLAAITDRPPAEQRMLIHDNAKRIYRLDAARATSKA